MANSQHYANAPTVKLGDYIPTDKFRTIHRTEADLPGGISEIKVVIDIERPLAKKLSFRTSSSGRIHGFVRMNDLLRSINTKQDKGSTVRRITINDWDDKALMIIEMENDSEMPFFVPIKELINLLENCRRAPQQSLK
ncbi:MAG: hypothetical protein ACI4WS_09805 [Oscillospiraceae bacterium]